MNCKHCGKPGDHECERCLDIASVLISIEPEQFKNIVANYFSGYRVAWMRQTLDGVDGEERVA